MKELHFTCTCTSELCQITVDPEYDLIELAFYEYGSRRPRWKQRLRHIWHIIRKGDPWTDYMDIRSDEARRIADFLNEAAQAVEDYQNARSTEEVLPTATDPQ